jgi:hypothetical protein
MRPAWIATCAACLASVAHARAAEDETEELVWVELVSSDPLAVLEKRPRKLSTRGDLAGVDGWRAVCIAPCRSTLARADGMRVGGSGVDPLYFNLPEGAGPYTVYADTGSAASETAGLALILTGGAMLMVGAISTVALGTGPLKNAAPDSAPTIMFHASITSIILGGTTMLIGVPLRFASMGDVEVEQRTPTVAPTPTPPAEPKVEVAGGLYLTPGGLVF